MYKSVMKKYVANKIAAREKTMYNQYVEEVLP